MCASIGLLAGQVRPQPNQKALCSFTGIATNTADCDVLGGDEGQVVDDVFPRCATPIERTQWSEFIAAVDANEVTASDLGCEFSRNLPLIPSDYSRPVTRTEQMTQPNVSLSLAFNQVMHRSVKNAQLLQGVPVMSRQAFP